MAGRDRLRLTYKQLFTSPFLQTKDTELAELFFNTRAWPQDGKENVWPSLVLLSCPDRLELVGRRRVEDIQLKFATLLQTYLNHIGKFMNTSRKSMARTIGASTTRLTNSPELNHQLREGLLERMLGRARSESTSSSFFPAGPSAPPPARRRT